MTKDRRRAEDEPVTFDTPIEVQPGVDKRLADCTEEELLIAAGNHAWRVEQEMRQDIDRLTADPDE
jgi:hypothetical protein